MADEEVVDLADVDNRDDRIRFSVKYGDGTAVGGNVSVGVEDVRPYVHSALYIEALDHPGVEVFCVASQFRRTPPAAGQGRRAVTYDFIMDNGWSPHSGRSSSSSSSSSGATSQRRQLTRRLDKQPQALARALVGEEWLRRADEQSCEPSWLTPLGARHTTSITPRVSGPVFLYQQHARRCFPNSYCNCLLWLTRQWVDPKVRRLLLGLGDTVDIKLVNKHFNDAAYSKILPAELLKPRWDDGRENRGVRTGDYLAFLTHVTTSGVFLVGHMSHVGAVAVKEGIGTYMESDPWRPDVFRVSSEDEYGTGAEVYESGIRFVRRVVLKKAGAHHKTRPAPPSVAAQAEPPQKRMRGAATTAPSASTSVLCTACGNRKTKDAFSRSQMRKKVEKRRCRDCVGW